MLWDTAVRRELPAGAGRGGVGGGVRGQRVAAGRVEVDLAVAGTVVVVTGGVGEGLLELLFFGDVVERVEDVGVAEEAVGGGGVVEERVVGGGGGWC